MKFKLHTTYKKMLADTITPVSIYLKLRDQFPNSILLESSDYHGHENSFSFICCKPFAALLVENGLLSMKFPDGQRIEKTMDGACVLATEIQKFAACFEVAATDLNIFTNGLFGYMSYDAVRYFEDISINATKKESKRIPDVCFQVYEYVIVINHFKDELYLVQHSFGEPDATGMKHLEELLYNRNIPAYQFVLKEEEQSNFTDEEFLNAVRNAQTHCKRGDVFQMVLSREFSQSFAGDEFNVYRALRSVNPSPYLFYFDYGNFKLFGSSPEAQLVIKNNVASIHPIAGTFKRSGNDEADAQLAEQLKRDPKENAEHVMLVDLARNDISKKCESVTVETFREIHFYSHVIHLVSKVKGQMKAGATTLEVVADTFPAGTLSGAPKYKAMQLIDRYEKGNRSFYGGCVGFIGFNGDFNHAIMIRSFLSKNNCLFYQAGAGIVESSLPENELNEVTNKLAALKKALNLAVEL